MEETARASETLTLHCRLVGELRRFHPDSAGGEGPIEMPGPVTVADLLRRLELPERDSLVVGVNGTKAPHSDSLADGDEVTIVAAMTGGATDVLVSTGDDAGSD